jgi:DNA-binding transcriptional MerR regulator
MDNNDKNNSFIGSLSEIKDESSVQDTPSTAEKNQNHSSSVQLPNVEGESHFQIQDYKDESYHYQDQASNNMNDSLLNNNVETPMDVPNAEQTSQINYQSSIAEQTPSMDPSQGLISKPLPSVTERISEINNTSQNLGTMNSAMSSDLNEEATLNFEYDDDNTNTGLRENEEEEISITPNVEMQSIFKNLANIQMDEEKDSDEYSEFLNECLYKHIKKMPLTLNDRKKIVEINFHDPKKYSIHRLAKLTGVQRKTIRIWKMTYNEICEQQDLSITRIKKAGRNYSFSDKELELINFIDKLREEKVAVTSNMIIAKMLQLKPELKDKSMGALQRMCYRILQKNNYSLRRASHLGQPLPCKSMDLFYDFFRDIIRKRQELGIYDTESDLSRIVNIDETPIFFEMTTDKTYNKKGAKVVSIETKGNEKKLISTVLAVSANGKKLTPTLIFKGGKDGNLEGRYKNLQCVKDRKIAIYFQSNAWCDEGIFKKWVKDVYLHYEEKEIQKKCILIMDKAPSHIYRAKFLDKKKKSYVFIPGGLTRYLQPLDIGINRQFKDHLKNLYLANLADNIMDDNETTEKEMELLKKYDNVFGDGKRPSTLDAQRLNIINWVIDVWWNDEKIKTSAIINSFNKAAISYPLDGSKDTDFVFPEEVMNQKQ